jgi:hypothetical protein
MSDERAVPTAYEAEADRVERSPAQPSGPDRIDAADVRAADDDAPPAHVKSEGAHRMEH